MKKNEEKKWKKMWRMDVGSFVGKKERTLRASRKSFTRSPFSARHSSSSVEKWPVNISKETAVISFIIMEVGHARNELDVCSNISICIRSVSRPGRDAVSFLCHQSEGLEVTVGIRCFIYDQNFKVQQCKK